MAKKILAALPFLFAFAVLAFLIHAGKQDVPQVAEARKPIKILLVAGHDDDIWGAQFGARKEVDMNRELSSFLEELLENDKNFDVVTTQTAEGYTKEFETFLEDSEDEIKEFRKERLETFNKSSSEGRDIDSHLKFNRAPERVAQTLYGTNMYADKINADLALHIHFNDYPGRPSSSVGAYDGFAIYVPSQALKNSQKSVAVAETLFDVLKEKKDVSNLAIEDDGVIHTDDLIAVGARNSLEAASVLIEYGYISEKRFNDTTREGELKELAELTYEGLKEHFTRTVDRK